MMLLYYLIRTENTSIALECDSILKKNNISSKVIATPTSIEKNCGLSLRINSDDLNNARNCLNKELINNSYSIYEVNADEENTCKCVYTLLDCV